MKEYSWVAHHLWKTYFTISKRQMGEFLVQPSKDILVFHGIPSRASFLSNLSLQGFLSSSTPVWNPRTSVLASGRLHTSWGWVSCPSRHPPGIWSRAETRWSPVAPAAGHLLSCSGQAGEERKVLRWWGALCPAARWVWHTSLKGEAREPCW